VLFFRTNRSGLLKRQNLKMQRYKTMR
jgi:hypothetical protein